MNEDTTTPPALPQKRILALSVRGDNVWRISEPVLQWIIENGDEDLRKEAAGTLIFWEAKQKWFIDWGNKTGYFQMAERACHNLAEFKEAIKLMPADNPGVQRIIELALLTGEQFNKPQGIGRKNHLKQSRGRKRR